jgi:hypothetical protein
MGRGVPPRISAQDDARENRLVDLFNLTRPPNRQRHGTDAQLLIDGHQIEFELKSVTTAGGSVSTVRDLGPDHIAKWKTKHWIIAFYDGADLRECRYGSPDAMEPWIAKTWEYVRIDFEMAQVVPGLITLSVVHRIIGAKPQYDLADARRLHKNQYGARRYRELMDRPNGYSPERMLEIFRDRAKYVIERGSTLNNPHIPATYFTPWPSIVRDHAVIVRTLVRNWLASVPVQRLVQDDMP